MSYCRKSSSGDVYMYGGTTGVSEHSIVCMSCNLLGDCRGNAIFDTKEDALLHLKLHKRVGDRVPRSALKKLAEETKVEKRQMREYQKTWAVIMKKRTAMFRKEQLARVKRGSRVFAEIQRHQKAIDRAIAKGA